MKSNPPPFRAEPIALTKLVSLWFVVFLFSLFFAVTANGAPKKDKAVTLLSDYQGDIVLIEGKSGSGSGFIADIQSDINKGTYTH